jgi:hypothetical protein
VLEDVENKRDWLMIMYGRLVKMRRKRMNRLYWVVERTRTPFFRLL